MTWNLYFSFISACLLSQASGCVRVFVRGCVHTNLPQPQTSSPGIRSPTPPPLDLRCEVEQRG